MILIVGDAHYTVNNSALTRLFENKILEIIQKYQITNVILLGDYHDTWDRIVSPVFNRLFKFFNKLSTSVQVVYIVGNHDLINNTQFCTEEHFFNGFKILPNVTIVDKPTIVRIKNRNFACVPYVANGRFQEAVSLLTDPYDVIFCHQEFQGANFGHRLSGSVDAWLKTQPLVISGHIHKKQWLQSNIYYPGSPHDTDFGGDTEEKTVAILDDNLKLVEIPTNLPTKKTIILPVEDFEQWEMPHDPLSQIRVYVTGSVDKLVAVHKKFRKIIPNNIKVIYSPNKEERQEVLQKERSTKTFLSALMQMIAEEPVEVRNLIDECLKETKV